jgi:hypothetical protein
MASVSFHVQSIESALRRSGLLTARSAWFGVERQALQTFHGVGESQAASRKGPTTDFAYPLMRALAPGRLPPAPTCRCADRPFASSLVERNSHWALRPWPPNQTPYFAGCADAVLAGAGCGCLASRFSALARFCFSRRIPRSLSALMLISMSKVVSQARGDWPARGRGRMLTAQELPPRYTPHQR